MSSVQCRTRASLRTFVTASLRPGYKSSSNLSLHFISFCCPLSFISATPQTGRSSSSLIAGQRAQVGVGKRDTKINMQHHMIFSSSILPQMRSDLLQQQVQSPAVSIWAPDRTPAVLSAWHGHHLMFVTRFIITMTPSVSHAAALFSNHGVTVPCSCTRRSAPGDAPVSARALESILKRRTNSVSHALLLALYLTPQASSRPSSTCTSTMALSKPLALAALVCLFAAAAVSAQEPSHWGNWGHGRPKPWPKTPTTKLLILKSIGQQAGSESGDDKTAVVGDTGTFT